jgi:hypothetical protein
MVDVNRPLRVLTARHERYHDVTTIRAIAPLLKVLQKSERPHYDWS